MRAGATLSMESSPEDIVWLKSEIYRLRRLLAIGKKPYILRENP